MPETVQPETSNLPEVVAFKAGDGQAGVQVISIDEDQSVSSGSASVHDPAESVTTHDPSEDSEKVSEEDVSIALKATNVDAVPDLIKEITALGETFDKEDSDARLKLMAKAKSLWQSLETPRETMLRHCWAEPSLHCALTAGTDKGLWPYLAKLNGPFNAAEVAEAKGIEPALLSRLLRHVSSMGYLTEIGQDRYELNNFTKSMAFPFINAGYPCISGACLNALGKFHEYANNNGWKDPTDITHKKTFFEHLHTNPPYGQMFHLHMGGYRQGRPSWMDSDFFPVQEKLLNGFDQSEDATLLVDIGGSFGHDIGEFRRKFPDAPGRLVLQDLPVVIDQITKLDEKIERTKYDFFTEQPIKGARAYYMHSVLHDWSDETCTKILKSAMGAMKPGYSKLLINEKRHSQHRERTQENWENLLGKAGLKICNIWTVANGVESLIECELA
ncbi:hypothetical protein CEP52_011025 [Fusarium oligoseptatum]|uniref:O-methyltransferase C-terminal domain-containing protein n=1 Tax=Fusarium oligoseptatum TaxID=2604345 RepID=A0A428T5F6_9HYPO|nr:hypothetical protein CEP52_011025 [Fusarium oligoseptatum]